MRVAEPRTSVAPSHPVTTHVLFLSRNVQPSSPPTVEPLTTSSRSRGSSNRRAEMVERNPSPCRPSGNSFCARSTVYDASGSTSERNREPAESSCAYLRDVTADNPPTFPLQAALPGSLSAPRVCVPPRE